MPRKTRHSEHDGELNLAPIMNMVVILIPLLLLSVVFLSVGVINVSAPTLAPAPGDAEPTENLELTVGISPDGFSVSTTDGPLAAEAGCVRPGVTICLEDEDTDLEERFDAARRAAREEGSQRTQKELDRALAAYDFATLYEVLRRIKKENPDESKVNITADPDVPYALVVRVMDAVRYEVDADQLDSSSQFWAANRRAQDGEAKPLFPDPIIAIAR